MKWSVLFDQIWNIIIDAVVATALGSLIYYIIIELNLPINPIACSIIFGIFFFLFVLREKKKLKSAQDN